MQLFFLIQDKNTIMKRTILFYLILTFCWGVSAQQSKAQPNAKLFSSETGAMLESLSDNGLWATATGSSSDNATIMRAAMLVNVTTGESKSLVEGLNTDTIYSYAAYDVSNDGQIVVGQFNGEPAFYDGTTGLWKYLPVGDENSGGKAVSVTPDGHYAVGVMGYTTSEYQEAVAMWDLTTAQLIDVPGIPTKDASHEDKKQNRFTAISADGTKVLGIMSFSYLPSGDDLGGCFSYVYDVVNHTYSPIGFTETTSGKWTAHADGLLFISEANMSNNGKWVTGGAYMSKEQTGSEYPTEYEVPYLYNVETGEITVYDDTESTDRYGFCVTNDGYVMGATPAANPYRDFGVRMGKYWVGFTESLQQAWGYDLLTKLGIDNSGTPFSVSDDGLTMLAYVGASDTYMIQLPSTFASIAENTNLLNTYTVSPANNSYISKISQITITFNRDVLVVGEASDIQIVNALTGEVLTTAVGFKANEKVVTITFRKGTFEAGSLYDIVIPAKTICIDGDATRYNEAINLTYVGRSEKPLSVVSASPKDGASVGKIDLTTSPITLTFDTEVSLTSSSERAYLYQGDSSDAFAQLLISVSGKKMMLYPATTQYLYKDVDYRVVLPAGVVTDITGNTNTANEAFTLNYKGAYEREISYDDNILFEDDFSSGVTNFLILDNDGQTPNSSSKTMGFTSTQYGWVPVRSTSSSSNLAAASTSMYDPAGKSDDWMVVPLLNIPDQLCRLTFKSQSYLNSATDYLKVYIWESNNYYNALTSEIVEKIRTEGTLVYNEVQNPGSEEEVLEDDWLENSISLSEYAGKNIYIAFLNDNEDQSAVFVDDVQVLHELPFYAAITNDATVVGQTEITISGIVEIMDEETTFTTAKLVLLDGDGQTVDEINEENLNLVKGDTYKFSFTNPLPLTIGEVTDYSVTIQFNDQQNSLQKSVSSLAFEPTKRVILEEFTGTDCVNCPQGIVAVEKLSDYYGDLFIPMALHCYTGDPFSTGVTGYASFLNLTAAPSGIVQRNGVISYPMYSTDGTFSLTAPEGSTPCWMEYVSEEFNKATAAEITATASLNSNATKYSVPISIKYALNASSLNLKIFAVVLENNLTSYQQNGFSSYTDELLADWGKGGKYGESVVSPYIFNHVVRGYEGETFTGTPDLLPTDVIAGETYNVNLSFSVPDAVSKPWNTDIVVMLFDGNTDNLINAYKTTVSLPESIEETLIKNTSSIQISSVQNRVNIKTEGNSKTELLSADGRILAKANGMGEYTITLPAYQGVVVARVTNDQETVVKKIILR